jgi:hypothetical protein
MPTKTNAKTNAKASGFPLEFLYGGKAIPESLVLRGMKDLERELTRQFQADRRIEIEAAGHIQKTREVWLQPYAQDERLRQAVAGLSGIDARLGKQKLAPPKLKADKQRIFTGSIGATVTPPYNYQWTWNSTSGSPSLSVTADRNTGRMSFSIHNGERDASGTARAALGIYFRPATETGILRLSSNPAFNYHWWTLCQFASAHSDAFIGLYVGRYTLSGDFDGAPVNQQISLWNDDSWWSGAGGHLGSSSGFPLFAQFNVDRRHYYALWVWCGGRASGAGFGSPFWGSAAGARLNVTVPWIFWELFS